MKTEEEHMGRSIPRRVVAAAVALFLAGITWYHCGGFGLRAVMIWLVCLILAAIAYTDFKTMRIPNRMTAALLIPAFLSLVTEPGITLLSRAMGGLAVSLPMYLMTLAVPAFYLEDRGSLLPPFSLWCLEVVMQSGCWRHIRPGADRILLLVHFWRRVSCFPFCMETSCWPGIWDF